ncbi:MAG: patatin-like phospholipase family protein [Hyphomicrobiaceae bacterium]|nr:patatin-like phospholipase family protein [Hyphomicrobiaceae bacterium]
MRRNVWHALSLMLAVAVTPALVGGCATVGLREGIEDATLAQRATVAGLQGVRFWGDEVPEDFLAEVKRRLPNMPRLAQTADRKAGRPVVEILALSGGGGDGAFGAGFLKGWTRSGARPEFEVVTGVSAGAIIAPFAYLGPAYDDDLEQIWTAYRTSEIVTAQVLPGLLGGSALADTAPLSNLIAKYVDRKMMRAIAAEYRKGRMLLVGTTNLDAQRPVVWNMGEIASVDSEHALALFRVVILASAAIPGAFPPVSIPVTIDNKTYTELHVDGGTTREVFISPVQVQLSTFDQFYSKPPLRKLYLISNMKTEPEQQVVKAQTLPIAARAISTLIKSQSQGEIYRIYRMAKDDNAQFNFVSVPGSFKQTAKEFFDPDYQRALFRLGEEMGARGNAWLFEPPGTAPTTPSGATSTSRPLPARNDAAAAAAASRSPAAVPPASSATAATPPPATAAPLPAATANEALADAPIAALPASPPSAVGRPPAADTTPPAVAASSD